MLALVAASFALASLPHRWVYVQTNFFRPEEVTETMNLVERAAKCGYNGMVFCDTKIQSQDPYPDFYVKAVNRLLNVAARNHFEIIPGLLPVGYADGMLHLDPSLIESMPCRKVEFTVRSGHLEPDATEYYKNGSFQSANGDRISGLAYQDAPGKATFVDIAVEHDGHPSLRIDTPQNATETSGNCRLVEEIQVQPFHQYRFSFWAKSKDFARAADVRMVALDSKGNNVSFQDAGVRQTQEWKKHDLVFNSQNNSTLKIYLGVWGGTTGQLWLSTLSLKDAGFLNVDRRPLCPVRLWSTSGQTIAEGMDVARIVDPMFGNVPYAGEFDFGHPSPMVSIPSGSRLEEGEVVKADYYAAASTDSGKTSICLSDPATAAQERREASRAEALFHSPGYLVSQDEMRVQGWCGACEKSGKTTAQILGEDLRRSVGYLNGKHAYIWSDMFDPNHNAVDNYYLCKGSLVGDWKLLPPGLTVINWNSGKPEQSLSFFHQLGYDQILAGYYDGPVKSIKPWMETARKVGGLSGVMYTTWVGDYRNLEAFAKAAWGG